MGIPESSPAAPTPPAPPARLESVDAYRGLVMFLMMAELLKLAALAKAFPGSEVLAFLAHHQDHVQWAGCSLHDLIQPSFSFLVGVALPFSLAARIAKGQSKLIMGLHAAWRALLLCMLGVFLRSMHKPQTYFTFEDTLSQIGLGYFPLFLLGLVRPRWQWLWLVVLLVGYWGLFAWYPVPESEAFYNVGNPKVVTPEWPHHYPLDSFEAHWNKNSNAAWAFDRWWLNLFPRESPFVFNGGGYATLSFIPTLATMVLGLICGAWIRHRACRTAGRSSARGRLSGC
jgi:predicted acyltransferase